MYSDIAQPTRTRFLQRGTNYTWSHYRNWETCTVAGYNLFCQILGERVCVWMNF